jgi:hypothetical protein
VQLGRQTPLVEDAGNLDRSVAALPQPVNPDEEQAAAVSRSPCDQIYDIAPVV